MKIVRRVHPVVLLALGFMWGAVVASGIGAVSAAPGYATKSFKVGIGAPKAGAPTLGATATGGTLTVTRTQSCTQADGSATVTLSYAGTGGAIVLMRTLNLPANRSTPVTDQLGNQISATVPAGAGTAIDSFGSSLDSLIGTAATGGKLNL